MSNRARHILLAGLSSIALACTAAISWSPPSPALRPAATMPASPDDRFAVTDLLQSDDFASDAQLRCELERGGSVVATNGTLTIDVPAGATVWFAPKLIGPVMIEYTVTAISAGGPNDRVSDLNCFWMAGDARSPQDLFATKRTGKFADYDELTCYYVGMGGNSNTTTRFRRYIGQRDNRPLLPEHDLSDPADLIEPNRPYRIRLIACDGLVQFWRDDRKLFELHDDAPYQSGHFGWRTVTNRMAIQQLRVWRLAPTR